MLPDAGFSSRTGLGQEGSQCTYRCVVLPDAHAEVRDPAELPGLNAPTGAWCSLTEILATGFVVFSLNAPTGAWCSLTYVYGGVPREYLVSMHLQVRGAP